MQIKKASVLPGFGISMGFTLLYLSLLVLIPLSGIFIKSAGIGFHAFWEIVSNPRVLAALRLSFLTALIAAIINAGFGLLLAWVLVRYEFFGKKVVDALIDLPFALPTAVAGISLTSIYASTGILGGFFSSIGIPIAFTPIGITLALIFIGLPFVVRTIQPVLEDMDSGYEEAASCLGANRVYTFIRVVMPNIFPALLTGFALAFSRALGEYGSVVFISGNMPMHTEIAPLLIMSKLEQYDYAGANVIAMIMLIFSFLFLIFINYLQWRSSLKQD